MSGALDRTQHCLDTLEQALCDYGKRRQQGLGWAPDKKRGARVEHNPAEYST